MPLNKQQLKQKLTEMFGQAKKSDGSSYTAADKAETLANIIDEYVKTATVNVTSLNGTCVTPQGPGTIAGTGIGNLS